MYDFLLHLVPILSKVRHCSRSSRARSDASGRIEDRNKAADNERLKKREIVAKKICINIKNLISSYKNAFIGCEYNPNEAMAY